MPINEDKTVTITNPADYDGDPFDVAVRAVAQAGALTGITREALESARLMARNAELERELLLTGECDAVAWEDSGEGKKYRVLIQYLTGIQQQLGILEKAAGFNPKAKIGHR